MKILVINPGSTSTKLAVYDEENPIWRESIFHPNKELEPYHHINEQYEYRKQHVEDALLKAGIDLHFDAVIARGGLLKPIPGGVYLVDEHVKEDLWNASMEHASNLAAWIADDIAQKIGCPAYIADSVVTDELRDVARLTGIPELPRISIFHALNSRAVSRRYAARIGKKYENLNLIVVHLGGGISVSAHHYGKVVDVNNALNGEGPFSPERAGTIPGRQLVDLCFSGKYTWMEVRKMLNGKGGLVAHLGTTDVASIVRWAHAGNKHHKLVLESMLYTVAKQVGAMHVALHGQTDAIILTGGIAHSNYCVEQIREWVEGLAPIVVIPGEDEMGALAMNALGALKGTLPVQRYNPKEPETI